MTPKYQRIAADLREELANNNSMYRLPTEKELCARYQVSRQTIREALKCLTEEGLIMRRQGSGAYATGLHPDPSYNQIAILLPDDREYIYPRLQNDLSVPLKKEGFDIKFYFTESTISGERSILKKLLDQPPRAILVKGVKTALPNPNLDLYQRLWSLAVPTVFLHSGYWNFPERITISDENQSGSHILIQYLANQKHTRIAAIFRNDMRQGIERYQGYAAACFAHGLPFSDSQVCWYDTDDLRVLRASASSMDLAADSSDVLLSDTYKKEPSFLKDFISQKLDSCTAVICHNDEIAYWLIKELQSAGLRVPEDISVVSFGNSYLCNFSTPTLTSLAHNTKTSAAYAVDALLCQIRGLPTQSISLPWELIVRDSSC